MSDRVNYTNGKDMPIDALKNSFISVRINENLSFIYGRIHKMDKDIEEEKTRIYYGAIIPVSKGKLMGDSENGITQYCRCNLKKLLTAIS